MLYKYNSTHVWGRQLTPDKLRLYMRVAREEGAAMAKREGNKRQQLSCSFQVCGVERDKNLKKVAEKAAEKAAEIARLRDPSLRVSRRDVQRADQAAVGLPQGAAQAAFRR